MAAEKKLKYTQVGVRGTGRRKEATARVRVKPGRGTILINGLPVLDYLANRRSLEAEVKEPLIVAGVEGQYDVLAKVEGGGKTGQAGAIKMGLARALSVINPEYEKAMRTEGLMTRDARVKERKKYGLKKARRAYQFSKR